MPEMIPGVNTPFPTVQPPQERPGGGAAPGGGLSPEASAAEGERRYPIDVSHIAAGIGNPAAGTIPSSGEAYPNVLAGSPIQAACDELDRGHTDPSAAAGSYPAPPPPRPVGGRAGGGV